MNSKLEKRIASLFCKFRPKELPEVIDTSFGNLTSWNEIKTTAVSYKISLLNVKKLAAICLKSLKNANPSQQSLQNALWHLMFYDAVFHNNIVWNCAVLKDNVDPFPCDFDELEKNVVRAFRSEARNTEFLGACIQDIIWIMLIEKIITKRGIKHGKPFLAALSANMDQKYIFYYPKHNDHSSGPDNLLLLSKALGYESYRLKRFEGRDVKSMLGMIQRKLNKETQCVVYRPTKVLIKENIMDFTQSEDRKNYALSILPDGSTNLSDFSARSRTTWQGPSPLREDVSIFSNIRIKVKRRNSSVESVLRELICLGIISVPVPDYVRRLPYFDTNCVNLRLKEDEDDEEDYDYQNDYNDSDV